MELPQNYDQTSPIINTIAVDSCPNCNGTEFDAVTSGYDFELQTCKNQWYFVECRDCSCWLLNPRPCDSEIGAIYPEHYYSYTLSETISPVAISGKDFLDKLKFKSILKNIEHAPKSYLDIGCGDGRYLRFFAKKGLDKSKIYGLELSQTTADALTLEGFNVFNKKIEECREIPDDSIDLVTMFHVIEHVDNPREVFSTINRLLSPTGILVVETPNTKSVDVTIFKNYWWGGYHIPRHWVLFNKESLQFLFKSANFEVVNMEYQTGHSFWMYSFHHLLKFNKRMKMDRLSKWFDPMQGLFFLIVFTGIDFIRKKTGFQTSSIMMIGKKT